MPKESSRISYQKEIVSGPFHKESQKDESGKIVYRQKMSLSPITVCHPKSYHRQGCYEGFLPSASGLQHLTSMPGYQSVPKKRKDGLRKGYGYWRRTQRPQVGGGSCVGYGLSFIKQDWEGQNT